MKFTSDFSEVAFRGSVVLITGGGTGIGRAVAHMLARSGAIVVLAARRKVLLDKTAAEIASWNPNAEVFQVAVDIRDFEQVQSAVKLIIDKYGKITHLVNNAGGQFLSPADHLSMKGFQAVINLNLLGTWNVTRAVFDASMRRHGGSIVNILVAMQNGFPYMSHSGAARAAVENLSKSLAVEWGQFGIRVNNVCPGTIMGNGMKNYSEDVIKMVTTQIPAKTVLRRFGTEAEIASAVTFLLSPGAAYITGTSLPVDGGITLSSYPALPTNIAAEKSQTTHVFAGYNREEDAFQGDLPKVLRNEFHKLFVRSKL